VYIAYGEGVRDTVELDGTRVAGATRASEQAADVLSVCARDCGHQAVVVGLDRHRR
jgi:hypothetical protein